MKPLVLSDKGKKLIEIYKSMTANGYENNFFNIKMYKEVIKQNFDIFEISSLLDYGCGRVDYLDSSFDENNHTSAKDFFNLREINLYEPSIEIDERKSSDCVICFDVLEHIYIEDVKPILYDIFQYSKKLVILQIACYPAVAKLPNGENAHITCRHPLWWKGVLDSISLDFKDISVVLMCSTEFKKTTIFHTWSANNWAKNENFMINT